MKPTWASLSQVGAWMLSIIGTFLIPPPAGAAQFEQLGAMRTLAVFTIALFVGLMLLPLKRLAKRRWVLWRVAAAAFGLSLLSLLSYQYLTSRWTCEYSGHSYVIGSKLTAHGREFVEANPQRVTVSDWVMAHGGKAEEIWTKDSISQRRMILTGFYLLMLPLFTIAVITTLEGAKRAKGSLHFGN